MSASELPAHLEASGLLRRAEASGGFGTVLRKGDPDRGAIILCITSRGEHVACFERVLDFGSGTYAWSRSGPGESAGSTEVAQFLAKRAQLDPDSWAIELDIAEPERFIAETTSTG